MLAPWVLIFFFTTALSQQMGAGGSPIAVSFATKDACDSAKVAILKASQQAHAAIHIDCFATGAKS